MPDMGLFRRKNPMQALEAARDELQSRIGVLSGKRDTAQTTLDRTQEHLQAILTAGDLTDKTLLEKAQDEVDRANSRLRGIDSALAALQSQLSDVTQKIVDERNASARAAASEKLQLAVDQIDRAIEPYLTAARGLASALDLVGHHHYESGEARNFVIGVAGQVELAGAMIVSELRAMVNLVASGTAPIPTAPPEAAVVAELPTETEPTQVVFALKSFKFKDGHRTRYCPQYEDSPPLPVPVAQRAIRAGCAVVTSDERRAQLRGSKSGVVNPAGIDVVDLDQAELPAMDERYVGPDPVLVAADFRVVDRGPPRLLRTAGPSL
jgi:hypothetical protein